MHTTFTVKREVQGNLPTQVREVVTAEPLGRPLLNHDGDLREALVDSLLSSHGLLIGLDPMLFGRSFFPPPKSSAAAGAAAAAVAASSWFGSRTTAATVACSTSSALVSQSSQFARHCWLRTKREPVLRFSSPPSARRSSVHPYSSVARAGPRTLPSARSLSSSSNVAKSSSSPSSPSSFVAWYEDQLHHAPVRTKMFTGLCLWSLGDAVAQLVPPMAGQAPPLLKYDWERTGRAALFGFALHAPTSHVHYNFLEWMTVKGGFKGLQVPIFKTIMEQFVYWSWVSNSLYHAAMGAMQGMNSDQIVQRIKDVLWDTQKAQWVFWIPVQLLNFYYVPVRHQLNVVLLTSVVWTALLSAWYPPQQLQAEETQPETAEAKETVTAPAAADPES